MKITDIEGFGSYGAYIDELDFNDMSDEVWMEVGKLYTEKLLVIIRNCNMPYNSLVKYTEKFGPRRYTSLYTICRKYVDMSISEVVELALKKDDSITPEDQDLIENIMLIRAHNGMQRVSAKKNKHGKPMGMFQEGDLLWHSNESGQILFTPGILLYGAENMIGSSTGFVQTADYYENVSESFRSELDEMVIVHRFEPGRINPGLNETQDRLMKVNMCPEDSKIPLVIKSPGGIKGLHYSINTVSSIDGMTDAEAKAVFEKINKDLLTDKYIFDHWYLTNNDLLLFDNSITAHRRLGSIDGRLAYRTAHTFDNIVGHYNPYIHEEYSRMMEEKLSEFNDFMESHS